MSQEPPTGWGWQPPDQPPAQYPPPGQQPSYPPPGQHPQHPPAQPPSYPPQYPPTYPPTYPPNAQYPQYGAPAPQYGLPYPPVYAAPQPGVVPLRPLTVGELLDGAVQTIRRNPKVMLGLSALVNLVVVVVTIAVNLLALLAIAGGLSSDSDAGSAATVVGSFTSVVLNWIVTTMLTGLLVVAVSEAVLGRQPSIGEVWARGRGRLLRLLALSVLIFVAIVAMFVVAAVPGAAILLAGGSTAAGVLVLVFAELGVGVLAVWISIRWLFAAPALLLEQLGVFASLGRSWRLVRGSWWRVFGIFLLTQLLAGLVGAVLKVPFAIVGAIAGVAIGDGSSAVLVTTIVSGIGSALASTLTSPFSAAILALLYIDTRMRREGLDVTLQQAAAPPTP